MIEALMHAIGICPDAHCHLSLFQLLAAERLDEMYVTHCPWIIGGVGAPSLCDGAGFDAKSMRRLELLDMHASGSELFLHYRVLHTETAHGAR